MKSQIWIMNFEIHFWILRFDFFCFQVGKLVLLITSCSNWNVRTFFFRHSVIHYIKMVIIRIINMLQQFNIEWNVCFTFTFPTRSSTILTTLEPTEVNKWNGFSTWAQLSDIIVSQHICIKGITAPWQKLINKFYGSRTYDPGPVTTNHLPSLQMYPNIISLCSQSTVWPHTKMYLHQNLHSNPITPI